MPASPREHTYGTTVTWTGNTGSGTTNQRAYERLYDIASDGKPGPTP